MSFKATLLNNQTETQSFKNIEDLYAITVLETSDVAPLKIDFATGEISINNTPQTRRIGEYFYPHAKPIQYRKVVHDIILKDLQDIEIIHEWEEQWIGYEYAVNNIKTKIELCSNTEIQAITAYINQTDLETEHKYPQKVIRLY